MAKKKAESELKTEVILIDETYIKNRIYMVRGQKVMLDYELAEIYGYTTTRFNEQVKNNIEKFDDDFMFQLTKEEFGILMSQGLISKNSTSNRGGRTKPPKVFTEQGIYMLMTVLKGEKATVQSKALIRTFKKMKDYIIENQGLIGKREYLQLSMQLSDNISNTISIRKDLNNVEERVAEVIDTLSDVVYKSELSDIMTEFGNPQIKRDYLVLNGEPFKADLAFTEIYSQANNSIYIVDNYIGIKTLEHFVGCEPNVQIFIFSDNVRGGLRASVFSDFCKEYPHLKIQLIQTCGKFHDRYIILDYEKESEKIYLCGASSKDAGARITSITEFESRILLKPIVDTLLKNPALVLK